MNYKAFAINNKTGCAEIIEGDFENKVEFAKWFAYKCYKCNEPTIKEYKLFDYINDQTPHTPDDFKRINEIPEDYKGYNKALELYKRFKLELLHYNRKINRAESMDEKLLILSELNGALMVLRWFDIDIDVNYHNEAGLLKMACESAKYNGYELN